MPRFFLALLLLCLGTIAQAETYELRNGNLIRRFELKDGRFRTLGWTDKATGRTLDVDSDEFAIRLSDGTVLTADDYEAKVVVYKTRGEAMRSSGSRTLPDIEYVLRSGRTTNPLAPTKVFQVFYPALEPHTTPTFWSKDTSTILKQLEIKWAPGQVDGKAGIEAERFRTKAKASRGGRGEPVVIDDAWIILPHEPTTLTRHTDGNQPAAYAHRFEKVGNHSFVDYNQADVEPKPQEGLVRCLCFPVVSGHTSFSAPIAVFAVPAGSSPEQAVIDYSRPAAKTRSYTHYNNWFDPAGKNLKGDNLPAIHRQFVEALKGSGIKVDGMVPDNGWQDRKSVWQPAQGAFPAGMQDLNKLSETLLSQGSSLGLWMAADGTTNDINWGVGQGYVKAQPNSYFKQYFAHYSLADEKYQRATMQQLATLSNETKVSYLKFDFNHFSNVVPTDRHGHAAEFFGFAVATLPARAKGVFINATNWTWHSPAWLNYADSVWLLAGDDGFNGNWPELSGRAQATTDRDVYFWRMWGDPSDRPWFPISNIMTHGIIRNARGQMSFPTDLPRDWSDHVLMHYGRGTLLREWYLSPASVTPDEWKALIAVHQWTEARKPDMINTCYVGGRPDDGHAYGYMGWSRDCQTGTLVARNPAAGTATLSVRLDATTFFSGKPGQAWHARMVYPYRMELPTTYRGGETAEISIPGYETVALEFSPGEARGPVFRLAADSSHKVSGTGAQQKVAIKIADFISDRRELLLIGRPALPNLLINGQLVKPTRQRTGAINQYPGYARHGMLSAEAKPWQMAGYDLKSYGANFEIQIAPGESATTAEAWLLTERPFGGDDKPKVTPLTFPGAMRHTTQLLPPQAYAAVAIPPSDLSLEAIKGAKSAKLTLEVFGNNGKAFGDKTLTLNGIVLGVLPTGTDQWSKAEFKLSPAALAALTKANVTAITCPKSEDKFKVRNLRLTVTLADGSEALGSRSGALTSHADWTYFEGKAFGQPTDSGSIPLGL
ncbi:MAG: hypothetical protein RLZ70_422 [Verrucomicrobiota bacterium]|jgi:hypothetical protein